MLKTLKFKGDDSDFLFVGCLHHHHNPSWPIPLWKMRGFDSVEKHDEFQIEEWNKTCGKNSTIFLLGDTIFGDPNGDKFKNLFRRLNFKHAFIQPGNHFSGYLQNYRRSLSISYPELVGSNGEIFSEVYPLDDHSSLQHVSGQEKLITYISNYTEIDINGTQLILSHYAIRSWNKMARNSFMLHSHEHGANKDFDWNKTDTGKILDLGYDNLLKYNNGAPISLKKIKVIMDKKPYKPEGHH
jgi:calcineurin-like phosphoesterase family protein